MEQTARAEGYGIYNNIKHSEIKDAFMNLASATAARDAAFTNITTPKMVTCPNS